MLHKLLITAALLFTIAALPAQESKKLRALMLDGQNNHKNWPETTKMMKKYLEDTKLFTVDVATTAPQGTDPNYKPEFKKYDLVVSNYNGADWTKETQTAFDEYVKGGGGFAVIHAADNPFGNWKEYNQMIGVGGWGGRNEKTGPFIYLDEAGKLVRDESPGGGGSHGPQHAFQVIVRDTEHPITKGMPKAWMHVNDELYDKLRGPGENMQILATALAAKEQRGTGHHVPMIFTVSYGQGRVFHTPMGHGNDSQECVGFITTFVRGCEWAATGKVTTAIPSDFPPAYQVSQRKFVAARPPSREYKSGIVWPEPPVINPGEAGGVPADAVVLFGGQNMDAWENGDKWIVDGGVVTADKTAITSKQKFGDCQLHVEFATPAEVKGDGQGRGNSGLYLMNRYEVQVLDSYDNTTYFDGQCAAIYKEQPPMVNACRKPGEWQTYDIIFTAPRFGDDGSVKTPGYVTVLHNGLLVHNHFELLGSTNFDRPPAYAKHGDKEPLQIQFHGNPVRFRNIWIRENVKPLVGLKPEVQPADKVPIR